MGKAVTIVKILPESVETDIEELKKNVEEKIKEILGEDLEELRFEIVPIAFGIKAIKAAVVHKRAKEGWNVEELENIEGVSRVEVEYESLMP